MVSFLQPFIGKQSLEHKDKKSKCKIGLYIANSESQKPLKTDEHSSFTSHCSSLASPRVQQPVTFESMMSFIQQVGQQEQQDWSTQKIWQFIHYLVDRLENSRAYKGYFRIFLQTLDTLMEYMKDLKQNYKGLARGKPRQDLIVALMCVQALSKAYGRRGDIRASCYVLAQQVACDFNQVAILLQKAILNLDSTIKLRCMDFIVPRDSRRVYAALLELSSNHKSRRSLSKNIVRTLEKYGVHIVDFTEGDIKWLEDEVAGMDHEHHSDKHYMLEWLLHTLRPQTHPQPLY
eukprot:TRINITY_DN271_c0_g1_i6.p2 TRINITY_DN271_c0_g1~~TRINITY_DN271_c0_g1_i6.p2  ORF type:complete len:290 (-),score=9.99 TRINITY_DN271_c0_g1_i6:3374-4243(-)